MVSKVNSAVAQWFKFFLFFVQVLFCFDFSQAFFDRSFSSEVALSSTIRKCIDNVLFTILKMVRIQIVTRNVLISLVLLKTIHFYIVTTED